MGRKSKRENKSVYQLARERRELTIEKAGELMPGITPDRIARIESGSIHIQPEDVVLMAEYYGAPELRNYFCTHECSIGERTVDEIEVKSFAQIAIETINSLNRMYRLRERLLEIVEDGQVRPSESEDFLTIKTTLDKIAASVHELQLWVDGQIASGKLDKKIFGK